MPKICQFSTLWLHDSVYFEHNHTEVVSVSANHFCQEFQKVPNICWWGILWSQWVSTFWIFPQYTGSCPQCLFTPYQRKPTEDVFIELEEHISNHPFPVHPTEEIDFSGYQLISPHLVQGEGIVGHGICFMLIEELGRWPGQPSIIARRLFSWEKRGVMIGKIPASFVAVSGVEVIMMENSFFRFVWSNLEIGMVHGL